jgi:hypothetical protein
MIESQIVLDSINPAGNRLTTWMLTYPRFIHSEIMTHRSASRNSASSRAIPSEKLIADIIDNPTCFEQVGRKNKGMQAQEICTPEQYQKFHNDWFTLCTEAIEFADKWSKSVAKQVVNRALEPWMHMTVIFTMCSHKNFFRLRAHPAAQPEFQVLAYGMLDKYLKSTPQELPWGEWHLPGLDEKAADMMNIRDKLKIVTALACRASYSAFKDGIGIDDAIRIHDRGVEMRHWSPFEHPALATPRHALSNFDEDGICSGWAQYRKNFPNEGSQDADLNEVMATKPDWIVL